MNLEKYYNLMDALPERGDLMQESSEWLGYMEFISAYFENRGVVRPVVVEIGVYRGATRAFYEQLIGAQYVSIDVDPNARPNILGNSKSPAVMGELLRTLGGQKIDLLFIDGDHKYQAAKLDYEMYSPLAKHLVVLHDVIARRDGGITDIEVYKLWEEIIEKEDTIVFKGAGWIYPGKQTPIGIGVVLKRGAEK